MVYQDAGTNFQVTAKTIFPSCTSSRNLPKPVNRCRSSLRSNLENLRAGDFQGHLQLRTNDPDFPTIEIAVRGRVQ